MWKCQSSVTLTVLRTALNWTIYIMDIYIYTWMDIYIYGCLHTWISAYTNIYIHTWISTYMDIYIHGYLHAWIDVTALPDLNSSLMYVTDFLPKKSYM